MTAAGLVARDEKWQVSMLVGTLFAHNKERHVLMKGTQPPTRLTNGALATATQQGPEERTGPAGNAHCLTLLSEPTRKLQPHKRRPHNGAHRCGAKHIWSSKCAKHFSVGWLLEVTMSKKCTPLWREAHLEVKMCKTPQCRTTFGSCDVEKLYAGRYGAKHIWKLKC